MQKASYDSWPRLARAAADGRDELRRLLPEFDRAIERGTVDIALLVQARATAARVAEGLRLALKAPERPRSVRRMANADRFRPLWAIPRPGSEDTA